MLNFRPEWSCIDHINTARIIMEQSVKWYVALYLAVVDFKGVRDILSHTIIKSFGAKKYPPKIISITKLRILSVSL